MAVGTFEEIIGEKKRTLPSFEELAGAEPAKAKLPSFEEIVSQAEKWLEPGGEFLGPMAMPAKPKPKPIPFIPPFGGPAVEPGPREISEKAGLPEIAQTLRELVAPTTPYTERETRQAFEQIPRALENIGVRTLTLGGLAGPLMGLKPSELRAALDEDIREGVTAGLAPALAPATGETALLAVEWGYVYPRLFQAVGATGRAISKIPQVAKGTQALKAMGGIDKVAAKYPRLYNIAENAVKSFTKGAAVGGIAAAPEALGEELPAGEVVRHISKNAAIMGGVTTVFSLASELDTRHWVNTYRKGRLEGHNQVFDTAIADVEARMRQTQEVYRKRIDAILRQPRSEQTAEAIRQLEAAKAGELNRLATVARSIASEKITDLRRIDTEVATAEAELRGMKAGDIYKRGQELIEKPDAAARRAVESLKIGLGRSQPSITMPTTRVGEAIETAKEVAGVVRHPVKAIEKATIPTRPPVMPKVAPAEVPPMPPRVTPPPVTVPVEAQKLATKPIEAQEGAKVSRKAEAKPAIGALPGMEAEVRDTTAKEIQARFPEFEGMRPEDTMTPALLNNWPGIRDEWDRIAAELEQLSKQPEGYDLAAKSRAKRIQDIENRIDQLSDYIGKNIRWGAGHVEPEKRPKAESTEPGGEEFERLRAELEAATGQEYSDEAVQVHVEAAGGWKALKEEKPTPAPTPVAPPAEAENVPGLAMQATRPDLEHPGEFVVPLGSYGISENADGSVWLSDVYENAYGSSLHKNVMRLTPQEEAEYKAANSLPNKERFPIQRKILLQAKERYKRLLAEQQKAPPAEAKPAPVPPEKAEVKPTAEIPQLGTTGTFIGKDAKTATGKVIKRFKNAIDVESETGEVTRLFPPFTVYPTEAKKPAEAKREGVERTLEDYRKELEEDGDVVVTPPGVRFPIRYKIVKYPDRGWVVEEHEQQFVTTHGPVGPAKGIGQWSREQAIEKAMQKIAARLPAEKPAAPVKPPEKPQAKPEVKVEAPKPAIGTIDKPNVAALADALYDKVVDWVLRGIGQRPVSNTDIKNEVARLYGVNVADLTPEKGYSHKKTQEALEGAIVRYARYIIETGHQQNQTTEQIFKRLVTLYENQPVLMARTGKTIERQAYSTPAPLAFVASELAGIDPETMVFEPTAGTGMLTIGADPKYTTVNEIDPVRSDILAAQGFGNVLALDARTMSHAAVYDAVIMNPPFGTHPETKVEGYRLSKIEHIIAANTLKAMKNDGRAVMIIGAPKHVGPYSKPDWVFGNYVYENYNVIADFEVSGGLYRRQGAAWPVRVIAVHGREKSQKNPPKKTQRRALNWETLYNILEEIQKTQISGIELPQGWSLKSGVGQWQVLNEKNQVVGEIIQLEDGSFNVRPVEGRPEAYGMPEQGRTFNNFADALKALSNQAKQQATEAGKAPKVERIKVDVVPTAPRKKLARVPGPRRPGAERPAEELEPVRGPARYPPAAPAERPAGERRPGELPPERVLPGERAGGRPRPGGLAAEKRPVPVQPPREPGERLGERPQPPEGPPSPVEARGERPRLPEGERKPEAPRVAEHKRLGVVGLAVGKLQVPYKPASKAPPAKENIPTYLEPHVVAGLNRLIQEVGDIDEYVRSQLQYESVEEMWEELSSTQIDTIALALYRLDRGHGFIVGHQTGVGKGRIAAAVVRREILEGRKPIFVTSKGTLFTDFYRDLTDIGVTEDQLKPLILNVKEDIRDQENCIVFQAPVDRTKATEAVNKALSTGDYNIVFATYHQVNTDTRIQRSQLLRLGQNQILILDESHNAAGQSNTGEYMQLGLIPNARGVVFMSATYAKTPKTMTLYARTGLLDAFDGDTDTMVNAVSEGGEPFQEVIAAALARANAYARTELDFSGISYETVIDATHKERDAERADKVTSVLRRIIDFDEQFAGAVVQPQKDRAKEIRKRTKSVSVTVTHAGFAATAHNVIKQMLLCLKIDETVEMTRRALKDGKRPFIGLENTMGTFLNHYVKEHGFEDGDIIKDFDYREVLRYLLSNVLRYRSVDAQGTETIVIVPVESLPETLQHVYNNILKQINDMVLDLPGSPIDEIINRLEKDGYKVSEITGRDKRLVPGDKEGEYRLESRTASSINKMKAAWGYNNADIDVLVGNVAAAEGISIHASEKFGNKQQRHMIVVQPHADINKFVQMLGRVNRTGQVVNPEYRVLMTALPSEIRPAAILERKMRSLNANTSAKTKGMYQQKDIPDILNLYGDYLTARYVLENPQILRSVRISVDTEAYQDAMETGSYRGPWHADNLARRFTGKLAMLPVKTQEEFYDAIEPAYRQLVEYLTKMDQNELISSDKNYKARSISSQMVFVGEPGNVFQEPAMLDKMSIVIEGRPMNMQEINEHIKDVVKKAGHGTREHYIEDMRQKMNAAWEKYKSQPGVEITRASEDAYERASYAMRYLALGGHRKDSENNPLVLLSIEDTFAKASYKTNPAAPSNITLHVAIPDPAKIVSIPLSQWENLQRDYRDIDEFFNVPADRREERYIANGNIIAGMGVIVGQQKKDRTGHVRAVRPKVINYTMEDGTVRQGLLLPKDYNPAALPKEVNMIPEAAAAYLMDGAIGAQRYIVIGRDVSLHKLRSDLCDIHVPKSKARGMKFYGDAKLVALTGEFETWHGVMRAVFHPRNLIDILIHLKARGNSIKSDPNDPDTAREYNNAHRDRPESDFAGEDYGMPQPVKVRKIALKIEAPPKPKKDIVARRDIVRYLSKALGVPIRGVATFRKKRPGWYNARTRGIRMRHVNDLRVACHEIGHHIDIYFNNKAASKMSHAWYGMGAELVRLGKALYGRTRPKGGYKAEGYAEFIFGWLTRSIDLKVEAPKTLKFFEELYLKDNPEISDVLHTARDMIDKWKEQGAIPRIDSAIGRKLKGEQGLWERYSLWHQMVWSDVSAPIQRALQENIPSRSIYHGANDPGFLYGFLTQTEGARARTFVMEHTIDMWGNVTGISLKQALAPVADRIKEWVRYVVSARALNLEARGIHSGFDSEDCLYAFKLYDSPVMRKVTQDVTDWNDRVLQYLVDAGALSADEKRRARELNPVYIPFLRAFAPDEIRGRAPRGVGRGMIRRGKGIYKIVGSDRPIEDPLESMILQVRRLISVAHKAAMARAWITVEQKYPGLADVIEKVAAPVRAVTFNAEQLQKQLAALGIDVVPGDLSDAMLTVFGNSPMYLGKEHIISIVINGRRSWYQISPELYRVLEDLDQFQLPKLLSLLLGKAARAVRLGAVGINPAFGLARNWLRDNMDTVVKARYARGPVPFVKGVAKDLSLTGLATRLGFKRNQAAEMFIDLGGKLTGYLGQDRTSAEHLKGEMLANTVAKKAIQTVRHPIEAVREVFGIPEAGLRIEEFERALKDWMQKFQPQGGAPPPDAIVYAFAMASDQTINYRRAGLYGRWLNSMTVFWNANAQDISKVYRTFAERPKECILWGLSTLTLASLGIWWLNKDEEWYKELPPWEKANYIHIPIFKWGKHIPLLRRGVKQYKSGEDVDHILRLPVPFLMGHIFMSMPVTLVDTLYRLDPKRVTDFLGEVYRADLQPLFEWPAAIAPYLNLRENKDWTGRPIIPKSLEGKLPEDQYKYYTTEFCKVLGKVLKLSPLQIEYALNAYSGGLYRRVALDVEKRIGWRKRETTPADWPIIGTLFVRDPYAPRQSIEHFYDRFDELNRRYASRHITGAELAERQVYNRIAPILSLHWKMLEQADTVEERRNIYRAVSNLTTIAQNISHPPKRAKTGVP